MVPGLRVRYEDNETLNAGYSFSASADLLDVNVVFLAFFDRLWTKTVRTATITSPLITHRHVPPPFFVSSRIGCYGRKQQSFRQRPQDVPRRVNLQLKGPVFPIQSCFTQRYPRIVTVHT